MTFGETGRSTLLPSFAVSALILVHLKRSIAEGQFETQKDLTTHHQPPSGALARS